MDNERRSDWFPFPPIPDGTCETFSSGRLSLRAFGILESDLAIDFNQKPPYVVTQILHACTRDENGDTLAPTFFQGLTVSKRVECLLTIVTSGGASELSFDFQCENQKCEQRMEIDLALEELSRFQHQTDGADEVIVEVGDDVLRIRKPTGADQMKWLQFSFSDEVSAVKELIGLLVVDKEQHVRDEWVEIVNEAMAEADPLVNFSFTICCPYCSREGIYELNLEGYGLQELRKAQVNLIETVHRLAFHYHWSEQQILSIPAWRRSHYLSLIEKEENR